MKTTALPPSVVEQFMSRITALRVNLHGFIVIQGGKVQAEKYYEPFNENSLHRMFSVAKSFTSIAVGLLIDEGILSLEDHICDFFPEKIATDGAHPWLEEMTIRQMLSMTTCYSSTTFKRYQGDWTESFFRIEPDHLAGTVFAYDTSSAHTLAALVEKLTGQKLLDYLRNRALDKIGFSKDAYIMPDSAGVSQGGSGLVCTLRDMTKVACLLNDHGKWGEESLLPEWYIDEAVQCHVPTPLQPTIDEQQGYGYMFWRCRHNGYCMYGMGGQLAMVFPDLDLIFTTIGDTQGCPAGLQILYDSFYDTIYRYYDSKQEPIEMNVLPAPGLQTSPLREQFNGKYILEENEMGFDWIRYDFDRMYIEYENLSGIHRIPYRYGDWEKQKFPGTNYDTIVSAAWQSEAHFIMFIYIIEEAFSHVFMETAFRNDGSMSLRMINTSEPFMKEYSGWLTGSKEL